MSDVSTPAYCTECDTTVNLYRTERNTLQVACACDKEPVKVGGTLPEGWI